MLREREDTNYCFFKGGATLFLHEKHTKTIKPITSCFSYQIVDDWTLQFNVSQTISNFTPQLSASC